MWDKSIEMLVANYQHLVATQDKDLVENVFSSSQHCSLISVTKEFEGRDSIYQDFLIDGIRRKYSSIELINDGLTIRQLSDDYAIVIFKYHTECINRLDGQPSGIKGLETQVVAKENGQWKIVHVHYSK